MRAGSSSPMALAAPQMLALLLAAAVALCSVALQPAAALPLPPTVPTAPYLTTTRQVGQWVNVLGATGPGGVQGSMSVQAAAWSFQLPTTRVSSGSDSASGLPLFEADIVMVDINDPYSNPPINAPFGCAPRGTNQTTIGQTYAGKVLLMMLQCQPSDAGFYAEMTGVAALIMHFYQPSDNLVFLSLGPSENVVTIPTFSISLEDGMLLTSAIRGRDQLVLDAGTDQAKISALPPVTRLQVVTSGPLIAAEKTAIYNMIKASTMLTDGSADGSVPPLFVVYGFRAAQWNSAYTDGLKDPCVDKLVGVWCENGHVIEINIPGFDWKGAGVLTQLGSLTKLRILGMESNLFAEPVPTSWCQMTEMRTMRIFSQMTGTANGLSALPACLSALKKLVWFEANNNAFGGSLPDWSGAHELVYIDVGSNQLTTLPGTFPQWTQLQYIDASSNQLNSLPVFTGFTALTTVLLSDNQMVSTLTSGSFDGLSALTILSLGKNKLSGPLPDFVGCARLTTLRLEDNMFSGSIPAGWTTELTSLATFIASSNQIQGPLSRLFGLAPLVTVDLSSNLIALAEGEDLSVAFVSIGGPNMRTLRLNSNQLTGPWNQGVFTLSVPLRTLAVAHNQITGALPPDLFTNVPLTYLDLSFNNLTALTDLTPPVFDYLYLDLHGNPDLQVAALPSWIVFDGSKLTTQPDSTYLCPALGAKASPDLKFYVDDAFTGYQGCSCRQGNFGKPPMCSAVPLDAAIRADGTFDSADFGAGFNNIIALQGGRDPTVNGSAPDRSFTDAWYGNNRLTLGLNTAWTVDLSTGMASPPRVTILRFHFAKGLFNSANDVLSVFEGSSAAGNRVALIRGSDALPLASSNAATLDPAYQAKYGARINALAGGSSLVEVFVLTASAHVTFVSRDVSGAHFVATFAPSDDCPTGYFYDADYMRCRADLVPYEVGSGVRAAVYASGVFSIAVVLICMSAVITNWNHTVVRAAARPFVLLMLVFLLILAAGSLLYAGVPGEDDTGKLLCSARTWLTAFPLTGLLAVLLAKTNRMSGIFGSKKLQKIRFVKDAELVGYVGVALAVVTIFLGVYSGMPLVKPRVMEGVGSLEGRLVSSCDNQKGFTPWVAVLITYIAVLVIAAAFLAFKTKDLPSKFNESNHIMNAVFLLFFYGVLIVPLDAFIQDTPSAAVLIQGVGQALLALLLTLIIFGPKVYYLATKVVEEPKSGIQTSGMTRGSAAPGSGYSQGAASQSAAASSRPAGPSVLPSIALQPVALVGAPATPAPAATSSI